MTPSRLGTDSLGAASYPAIQLLQDRLPVLVALLVVANLPELFGRERPKALVDLFHGQLVVALDRELSIPYALLGVGERDVEKLRIAAHDLLGHLLEGLLLLLSLLLEGLLLGLGLLHPLLGGLLDGLLLLGLPREVGAGGVEKLHVGVHQLLGHLLGVLLLFLDLLGQGLHRAQPLRLGALCPVIHPAARRVPIHLVISLPSIACRVPCVPVDGASEPRCLTRRSPTGPLGALFTGVRRRVFLRSSHVYGVLRSSPYMTSRKLVRMCRGKRACVLPVPLPLPVSAQEPVRLMGSGRRWLRRRRGRGCWTARGRRRPGRGDPSPSARRWQSRRCRQRSAAAAHPGPRAVPARWRAWWGHRPAGR